MLSFGVNGHCIAELRSHPVQLPLGSQLAIFIASAGFFAAVKRSLKPVARALYGSKGLRSERFQLPQHRARTGVS